MGLLRTPPQRANQPSKSPRPDPSAILSEEPSIANATMGDVTRSQTVADITLPRPPADISSTSLPSPTRAFAPRNPGVLRSPPSQPLAASSSVYPALPASLPPPPGPVGADEQVSMDIDEPSVAVDTLSSMAISAVSTPARARASMGNNKAPAGPIAGEGLFETDQEGDISLPSLAPTTPGHKSVAVEQPSAVGLPGAAEDTAPPPAPTTPASRRTSTTRNRRSTAVNDSLESFNANTAVDASTSSTSGDRKPIRADTTTANTVQTPKPPSQPKTPRSTRKTPAEISRVLNKPAEPLADIPISRDVVDDKEEFGRRWRLTTETLALITRRIVDKWTLDDLKSSMPLLAKKDPAGLEQIYRSSAQALQEGILNKAYEEFDKRNVRSSLQLLDQVVAEADAYEKTRFSDQARPDAWRSDLTPAALTAANVLPIYDRTWAELRAEYNELHEDARRRYVSLVAKQTQLKELEGSVSDGVVELDKTIKLLDGFPNEEMMAWMEDVAGRTGARDP